jgi:tetratricopeptide (TPR) repeat protein
LPVRVIKVSALHAASRAPGVSEKATPQSLGSPAAKVEFALADLAAANPYSGLDAAEQLDDVSRKYPDSPAAEESLGYFALTQNRLAEARLHFAKAVERHSSAPDTLFYSAHLDLDAGAPLGPVIELLQRVLLLDPRHYNARFDLGFAAAKANRFDLALSTLNNMPDVRPEHRYLLAYTLAYCYIHINRLADAQTYAEKAARLTGSETEHRQTEQLLHYISYYAGKEHCAEPHVSQCTESQPVLHDAAPIPP